MQPFFKDMLLNFNTIQGVDKNSILYTIYRQECLNTGRLTLF